VRRIARWFGEQHRSRWSRHGACLKSALAEEPDFAARRAVVVGGEDASNTPCFMCHGLDGVGDSAGAFPLTGQAAFYMYKQLIDHAAEARLNDAMTPIARDTAADPSDDDIPAVALYFEWLRPR
jgi:cytochrome c553